MHEKDKCVERERCENDAAQQQWPAGVGLSDHAQRKSNNTKRGTPYLIEARAFVRREVHNNSRLEPT